MATFNTIAAAVKTQLETLSTAPTVDIRKTFVFHPREESDLPLLIISFGSESVDGFETMGNGSTDYGTIGRVFQVILTYIAVSLGDVESSLSTVPNFWEDAKQLLNKPSLTGVSSAWNVDLETHEEWNQQAFGEGHEKSEMVLTVYVSEARNG